MPLKLESLDPDVSKLHRIVVPLEFDWSRFGAFFFARTGFVFDRDIIVNKLPILINGDASVLGFLPVLEASCAKSDVIALPFSCLLVDEFIWLFLTVETPSIRGFVILLGDSIGIKDLDFVALLDVDS